VKYTLSFSKPEKTEYMIPYNRSSSSRSILRIFTCAHYRSLVENGDDSDNIW